jgi:hypothetical protein
MQGVQGYVWLKLITPTIIVPTDHGFWKPRGGVLGFIAGWLVGPYAAAGPLAENGRKNDAGISAQWRLSYLSAADFGASSSV